MRLQFGARLNLDMPSFSNDNSQTRRNIEDLAGNTMLRFVLKGTDPDIVVTVRRREGLSGSEALVHIDKPPGKLPGKLAEYATPQKFFKFKASDMHELGPFSGTAYLFGNVCTRIAEKVIELHLALHPNQPLGLLPKQGES